MSRVNRGNGVQKFWEEHASGAEVDVKAIFDEHPEEALEIADAMREAAIQEDSAARERMWLARSQALNASGEEVTLGSLIRTTREEAGLSTSDLSRRVQGHSVRLLATAIEQLETDRVEILNVKTPGLWLALAEILQIDRHRLIAAIQAAISGPEPAQRFTRMNREATSANRARLLTSGMSTGREEAVPSYLAQVRTELGLPPTPTNTVQ